MYWFDTTLLALLGLGALLGAWSGLVNQVARFVCLGVSIYAAVLFHEPMAVTLHDSVLQGATPQVARVVGGIVVFLSVYLSLHFASRVVRTAIRAADLEGFDRLLGAVLGAAKMALLLGVICLSLASHPHPTTDPIMARSSFAPAFADGMERVVLLIPEEYKTYLRENIQHFGERFGHDLRPKQRPVGPDGQS